MHFKGYKINENKLIFNILFLIEDLKRNFESKFFL